MRIDNSTIQLAASHRAAARTEVHETLRAWVGDSRPSFEQGAAAPSVSISSAAQAMLAQPPSTAPAAETQAVKDADDRVEHDPMLYMLKLVVEMLTGVRVKTMSASDLPAQPPPPGNATVPESGQRPTPAGYGIEYDRHEVREESEHLSFSAQGIVRTADGKEITLDIAITMERNYREESSVSLRSGDGVRKDPLVINFGGSTAQLQNTRFSFDLDGDGNKEQVPILAGNSGYLALDANGNGKIDSGKELFGATSGDGFADLAQYDSDSNGWIDEGDAVFAQLRVWMQDGKGGGTLRTLKDSGVGALYLGRTSTPFELRGAGNQELGAVRSSGLYLNESGSAGTLQQIDLTV